MPSKKTSGFQDGKAPKNEAEHSSSDEMLSFPVSAAESSNFDSTDNITTNVESEHGIHHNDARSRENSFIRANIGNLYQDLDRTDLLLDEIELDVKRMTHESEEEFHAKSEPAKPRSILKTMSLPPVHVDPPFTAHLKNLEMYIYHAYHWLAKAKSILTQPIILSTTSSIGIMEAWETVLVQSLVELKPPKFRKGELRDYLNVKLRDIADEMEYICRVLMKISINSRIALNMMSKVWERVMDQTRIKGRRFVSNGPMLNQLPALNQVTNVEKKMVNKSILELSEEGLKLFNVKEPKVVEYDDFTYLERKAVLNSFIKEIETVVHQASHAVSKLFLLAPDFETTHLNFREKPKLNTKVVSNNLMEKEILELSAVSNFKEQYVDLQHFKKVKLEMERYSRLCEYVTSVYKTSSRGLNRIDKNQKSLVRGNPAKKCRKFEPDERLLLPFTVSTTGLVRQQEINMLLRGVPPTMSRNTVDNSVNPDSEVQTSESIEDHDQEAHAAKSMKTDTSKKKERIISVVTSSTDTLEEFPEKRKRSWTFWKKSKSAALYS